MKRLRLARLIFLTNECMLLPALVRQYYRLVMRKGFMKPAPVVYCNEVKVLRYSTQVVFLSRPTCSVTMYNYDKVIFLVNKYFYRECHSPNRRAGTPQRSML